MPSTPAAADCFAISTTQLLIKSDCGQYWNPAAQRHPTLCAQLGGVPQALMNTSRPCRLVAITRRRETGQTLEGCSASPRGLGGSLLNGVTEKRSRHEIYCAVLADPSCVLTVRRLRRLERSTSKALQFWSLFLWNLRNLDVDSICPYHRGRHASKSDHHAFASPLIIAFAIRESGVTLVREPVDRSPTPLPTQACLESTHPSVKTPVRRH